MSSERSKYLAKNTLIFTIGSFGSKFINFLLLPLYTNILTTAEYGTVDLVTTISTVAVPIITLNVCESVMRFALDKNADNKKITKIGICLLIIGILVGLAVIPICSIYKQVSDYALLTYFYVITMASSQMFLCDLRGKELLLKYSIGNMLHTLFVAVFNILFLVVLKVGIKGYLLAFIMSNILTALYAFVVGKGYKSILPLDIDIELLKSMIKYSVVLIPNSFMWWIMDSSDRIMVTSFVGIAANGIYAVSYKLPTLVTTTTTIFNQAWSYSAIREEGSTDESEYNNAILKKLIVGVSLIGVGIISISKIFLRLFVSSEYYNAWHYVPFLTIGCVFLTLATFMGTSYSVHKDSFGYLFSGLFGAILNVILNFLLIPIIEVYGAAIATCISYISVFAFRLVHTKKYIIFNIKCKEFVDGIILLGLSAIIIYWNNTIGYILQTLIFIVTVFYSRYVWLPILKNQYNKITK